MIGLRESLPKNEDSSENCQTSKSEDQLKYFNILPQNMNFTPQSIIFTFIQGKRAGEKGPENTDIFD